MNNLLNLDLIRVVIFDCDGVMFDSRAANVAYYNKILQHFQKPTLDEGDSDLIHMYTSEASVRYLFRHDLRLPEALEYRKRLSYHEFIPLMQMEPHLKEVLHALHQRCCLAVATNRTHTIHTILRLFDLEQHFDFVVCSLDVRNPKPDAEIMCKILDYFQITASEALYIGDTQVDQEVAARSGIRFIAYKNSSLSASCHMNDLREVLCLVPNVRIMQKGR